MEWFRLYDDLVYNAKAQSLPPTLFKHWVNLLCLASKNKENRGWLPSIDQISFALRMRPDRAKTVIQLLVSRGLLSELGQIHDWISCQRESDNSALRKQVQRNKDIVENVTGQSRDKTASDTDTEQIQIQNRADAEQAPAEKRRALHKLDSAYESFIEAFERDREPAKYPRDQNRAKDFTRLAALRKTQGLNGQSPPMWDIAIANYFASGVRSASVADLCVRYAAFVKSAEDRYGKSIGGSLEPESKEARIIRQTREINQQLSGRTPNRGGDRDETSEDWNIHPGTLRLE